MTQLLTINDIRYNSIFSVLILYVRLMCFKIKFFLGLIREHASLSTYGDANSVRKIVAGAIIKLIEGNPELHGKLKFPTFRRQRLYYLLNQRFHSFFQLRDDNRHIAMVLFFSCWCKIYLLFILSV